MKHSLAIHVFPRHAVRALFAGSLYAALSVASAMPPDSRGGEALVPPSARPSPSRPVATPASDRSVAVQAQLKLLARARAAVVGVRTVAVEDATSSETLGAVRQGSGVVIDDSGLVLTIGYLVVEADQVDLLLSNDRVVPARVVAYDVATGFGLLQALVPLNVPAVSLGEAVKTTVEEPLMIASGGDDGAVSLARLVSRREFSAYWEYHLDSALFTSPPRLDHSGAALINGQGQLIGIGSLVVADTLGTGGQRTPGNMFVPVDLLKPILGELQRGVTSQASRRAWLGINCMEQEGEVRVMKVSRDSPADLAGLQVGDRIESIDTDHVSNLAGLYRTLWRTDQAERNVDLSILRDGEPMKVTVKTQDRLKTLRHPQGI